MNDIQKIIEAILFAAADVVSVKELSEVLGISSLQVCEVVGGLSQIYDEEKRGFHILKVGDGYQMCTRESYYEYIRPIIGERHKKMLSPAAMETLAIIAYNQPITKSAVEHVRGVNSDGAFSKLLERGLIEDVGRLEAPGKPILYATTNEFLRSFAIDSLESIPKLSLEPIKQNQIDGQIKVDFEQNAFSDDVKVHGQEVEI